MRSILTNPIDAIIALAWALFLLYWGISAVRTKSTNWVVAILMAFALVGLFLLLRYGETLTVVNLVLWHRTLPLAILSVGIVLAGLAILIWARRVLGASWSATAESKENSEIVQKGPYRYVRHPMYTGFLTMVLGSTIAYGNGLDVLVLIVFTAGFCAKAMREESILKKSIGRRYEEYCLKTKAFIPFII